MKKGMFILLLLGSLGLRAQHDPQSINERRVPAKAEIRSLAHLADSVMRELKTLYKAEVKEQSPNKFQPERIALVRSYLLVFQHIENTHQLVSYTKADITQIFGKPNKIVKTQPPLPAAKEEEWIYENLQKNYVKINNLRYRFYFRDHLLYMAKRS